MVSSCFMCSAIKRLGIAPPGPPCPARQLGSPTFVLRALRYEEVPAQLCPTPQGLGFLEAPQFSSTSKGRHTGVPSEGNHAVVGQRGVFPCRARGGGNEGGKGAEAAPTCQSGSPHLDKDRLLHSATCETPEEDDQPATEGEATFKMYTEEIKCMERTLSCIGRAIGLWTGSRPMRAPVCYVMTGSP